MNSETQYELHGAPTRAFEDPPWAPGVKKDRTPPFSIRRGDGFVWVRMDPEEGRLKRIQDQSQANAGFCLSERRTSMDLVMVTHKKNVLVNGLSAINLTVLGPKDSVVLGEGNIFWVTQRVIPHSGAPLKAMLKQTCSFCRLKIREDTTIVTCKCGLIYHNETEKIHPGGPAEERLRCSEKVKKCHRCGQELTQKEHLIWNPEEE